MSRNFLLTLSIPTLAILTACGGGTSANVNVKSANTTPATAVSPVNAVAPPATTTNSPAPAATATPAKPPNYKEPGPPPTPNTPPEKSSVGSGRVTKPGATPTPGIPSPEEMRRMMSRPVTGDPNSAPSMQGQPMMKTKRPLGGRVSGNSNRP